MKRIAYNKRIALREDDSLKHSVRERRKFRSAENHELTCGDEFNQSTRIIEITLAALAQYESVKTRAFESVTIFKSRFARAR